MSDRLRALLRAYRDGEIQEEEILQRVVRHPFEEHLLGRFDHGREARTGIPEVILAEGKRPDEVADIFAAYLDRGDQLLATRLTDAMYASLEQLSPAPALFPEARMAVVRPPPKETDESGHQDGRETVLVISAGTADRPVALEAAVSSRLLGNETEVLEDVGVAGASRMAPDLERIDKAGILIVVAGMDGVLPSFVAGLVRQPVIAVPTSAGYGTSFGGVTALLTMLNSCVPGTAVMNIDNGFGAAVLATKINQLATAFREPADSSGNGDE